MNILSTAQMAQSMFEQKLFVVPILLISIFTFMNAFTNYSGITYFVIVFIVSIIKIYINNAFNDNSIDCADQSGLKYKYSPFIFSFTMAYAFLPMFLFKDPNIILIVLVTFAFMLDTVIRYIIKPKCFTMPLILSQTIQGAFFGSSICYLMFIMGLSWLLFSNNQQVDSRPSNQQMRCKIYKNGELVGNNE